MPNAILAGLPLDTDRRLKSALNDGLGFRADWFVSTFRAKGKNIGVATSQLESLRKEAAQINGAHVLLFRSQDKASDRIILDDLSLYFRVRSVEQPLLKLIPHQLPAFLDSINKILAEELEWNETVKPTELSCCLLLPECAFSADKAVRHLWSAAKEPGLERIRLAAKASEMFKNRHWISWKGGTRAWVDDEGKVFDHRGARHGVAPFPRAWKYSYEVVDGFHFDVESADQRTFYVTEFTGTRHKAGKDQHINIDPHGYVR